MLAINKQPTELAGIRGGPIAVIGRWPERQHLEPAFALVPMLGLECAAGVGQRQIVSHARLDVHRALEHDLVVALAVGLLGDGVLEGQHLVVVFVDLDYLHDFGQLLPALDLEHDQPPEQDLL